MAKPLVEHMSLRHPAQSTSEKGIKKSGLRFVKRDNELSSVLDISYNVVRSCPMSCGKSMKILANLINKE
jgi:hypothetical protein